MVEHCTLHGEVMGFNPTGKTYLSSPAVLIKTQDVVSLPQHG